MLVAAWILSRRVLRLGLSSVRKNYQDSTFVTRSPASPAPHFHPLDRLPISATLPTPKFCLIPFYLVALIELGPATTATKSFSCTYVIMFDPNQQLGEVQYY